MTHTNNATQAPETVPFTCPDGHRHAQSETCYLHHKCRCTPCREHHAATMRQRRKEQAYGRYTRGYVDSTPIREHLVWLRTQGMGVTFISAASGVSVATLSAIIWGRPAEGIGPTKSARPSTAKKILAVRPDLDLLGDAALIDSRGTTRRIQALYRIGYSYEAQCRHLGVANTFVHRVAKSERVYAATARAVRDMYDELWDKPPQPETKIQAVALRRTIAHAKKRQWPGPLAWDDIDTDPQPPALEPDEAETYVDEIAVERALSGAPQKLTSEEMRAAVRIGHSRRWSNNLMAERLRVHPKTPERIRKELGLPQWDQGEIVQLKDLAA